MGVPYAPGAGSEHCPVGPEVRRRLAAHSGDCWRLGALLPAAVSAVGDEAEKAGDGAQK